MRLGWKRGLALGLMLALVALLGAARVSGALLQVSDGRAIGYSEATGEWLALDYPSFPAALDGPYVFRENGRRVQLLLQPGESGAIEAQTRPVVQDQIEVLVEHAAATRFIVPLRPAYPRAGTEVAMPKRLMVASDFEGEFDAFTSLMQKHGVIDAQLRWSFGDGQLVLVGDMVDRGRNVLPLLWLVYKLEAEAEAAGGALHYVLGNHEQKLLTGRTNDVDPKYFGSFRLSGRSQQQLFDQHSELGRWLRSKPALLKVGDYLFMHGGLSPEVLALRPTLDEVDRLAAAHLANDPRTLEDARAKAMIWDRNGVLWYRGLATSLEDMPKARPAHVQQVLEHFDVRHIVIGHTLAEHVSSDYRGAVLRVDVHHAGGTSEALLIEGDATYRVDHLGQRSALQPAVNLD